MKAVQEKKRAKSGQDFSALKKTGYIKSIMTKYVQEGSSSNRASIDMTPSKQHKEQIP